MDRAGRAHPPTGRRPAPFRPVAGQVIVAVAVALAAGLASAPGPTAAHPQTTGAVADLPAHRTIATRATAALPATMAGPSPPQWRPATAAIAGASAHRGTDVEDVSGPQFLVAAVVGLAGRVLPVAARRTGTAALDTMAGRLSQDPPLPPVPPGAQAPAPPAVPPAPPGAGVPAPGAGYAWPLLPAPEVVTPFRGPDQPFGPGHRGVDLAGSPGQAVLAARGGVVVFAGPVAGRGSVSVQHDDGLRTTYEPVTPFVAAGQPVAAGQVLGLLEPGHGACPSACLHWGARRDRLVYVDPLVLLRPPHVRLLPVPAQWPPRPD
ncbi:M23 family metallopeptidase [Pseudonocardia sp. CA-107938]|uniref:M23 family metallopeptidase n=1 Tax=Pseudonocardia sp. CA-107938 TaxID=3240021 RepID=UPI003D94BBAF